jgi:hypothetical protein
MPTDITLTPRLLYKEDLALTTTVTGETASVTVLGAGAQTLNKIPMVLFTQFTVAANDVAAAGAGVNQGEIYVTAAGKLRARLT